MVLCIANDQIWRLLLAIVDNGICTCCRFRRAFTLPKIQQQQRKYLLHITAHPAPTRLKAVFGTGANATKLLCSYKLWINGVPVAAGPGESTDANSTAYLLLDR